MIALSIFDELLSHSYYEKTSDSVRLYNISFMNAYFMVDSDKKDTFTKKQWYDLLSTFNEDWYEYSDWEKEVCDLWKKEWYDSDLNINELKSKLHPTEIHVYPTKTSVTIDCGMDVGKYFEHHMIHVRFKYSYDKTSDNFSLTKEDKDDKNPSWYL